MPSGVTASGTNVVTIGDDTYAAENAIVTLTSEKALAVDGTKLTAGENNTYTYTMTAADATVTVDFLSSLTQDETDTTGNTYLITSADELQELATYVNAGNNCKDLTFKLANDIDMNGVDNFTAIGWYDGSTGTNYYFSGTFDGGNYTISNLKINNTSSNYQGLFGNINGTVKNITLDNANITGNRRVGGVVGEIATGGAVDNCTVINSTVNATANSVGGVVGNNEGTVSGCTASNVNVSGQDNVGGVIGINGNSSTGTASDILVIDATLSGKDDVRKVVGCNNTTSTVTNAYYYGVTTTQSGSNVSAYDSEATQAYKLTLSDGVQATGGTTFTVDGVTYYSGTFAISGMVAGSTITVEGAAESETFAETDNGLTIGALTLTGLTKPSTTAAGWSLSGTTATYKNASTSAGYQLDNNQISYVKASDGETLITVTGVKSLDGISLSGTTVTVANSALNQGTVTVSDGYTLALGTDVTKTSTTAAGWSLSGSTATYKDASTSAGYQLDNNQISYVKASGGETLITVTGVKSLDGISLGAVGKLR